MTGHNDVAVDNSSDYGSDFDEDTVSELLSTAHSQSLDKVVLTSIEQDPVTEHAIVQLRSSGQSLHDNVCHETSGEIPVIIPTPVELSNVEQHPNTQHARRTQPEPSPAPDDTRSPLERFRTHPKKPLSVTDIVSPAWCEQQYLFSLSKHGRIRRTPAMRQGSAVHKVLEEQVHKTVAIQTQTREDIFGLKLWNIIQGLRGLETTGLLREMEVWGVLDGQVINGVIDAITKTCPDQTFEDKLLGRKAAKKKKKLELEADQQKLESFFTSSAKQESDGDTHNSLTYYVVDVKTRQARTIPADDGRFRGTKMQLMLYRRLLTSLAADEVDQHLIFDRYNLDGDKIFSDTLITEVANLDGYSDDTEQDSLSELLAHNSLSSLWPHMVQEYKKTIYTSPTSLSNILTAEFRSAADGAFLGRRSFEFDDTALDAYVQDEISWWKGERPTKGVEIEDAFKCRMCEFADECTWRQNKVNEAVQASRQKVAAKKSTGNG